jgi:Na+-transporting NADH:ubiquinone oxidoreductase subunit NqrC
MATTAVSIVDRLIQLATVRERNREKYFKNFIEPLYVDGEQIAKDYMNLLAELIHRIGQANDCREIADWLEARRTTFQPLRIKVRALIQDGFMERKEKRKSESLALFKKGLWGLMKGGVSAVEDKHALTGEYGFGDHTVLDLLHHERMSALEQRFRDLLTRQAQRQQEAIERAWQDVTNAYAELRGTYLP